METMEARLSGAESRNRLNNRVAVAVAVTALTSNLWLFRFPLFFAGFGGVMGAAGLEGLSLHPDWLTKLLS